ncbi:MAG TPA: Helicase associated domain protein, partial [Verrucomicrobiae bacterium]
AGREGRNFAFALDDKNLPIRKRLFLTATPRHYNPLNKNKDGDAQLVFSMDNAVTYGQQIYRLPFSKAAKRGIICRYKVVISVITSQQVTNELLSHGEVLVNGDAIRARQVANQIALKEAVTKYGVNKIFTFHSTVASAASFTSCGNGGVAIHLPDFKTLHVNGKMPTAAREREMRDFRNCKRGIISNARCLTEGVDVPAVDMVAFLAPRRSRVDIVQATGRAMRLDPANKKTTGYILVPLYLEQATNESVEQAVLRSDFSEVWEVLQSLQEQDEVLSEIIRDMRMERGCMKGFDDSRFRERVEVLGTQLTLNDLRKVITTKCIEILADNWEERFGELQSFKMRYGHCNVPSRCSENPRLGLWITNQRQRNRIGKLSVERVRRLEEIGFVWTPFDAAWEDNFARLAAYKQEHGHCNVRRSRNGDQGLASWLHHQRKNWKFGSLDKEQLRRLKELEVVWSPFDAAWEEMFAALLNYKQIHGNCNVPQGLKKNSRLASWVHTQRGLKNRGQLDNDRVQRLEKKGFVWDRSESVWEEMFELLKRYKSEHGNCKVPARWSENPELATWVHEQRKRCRRGKLSQERINKLEQIVFWNSNPVIDKE